MIAVVLGLAAAALVPQDTGTLDIPVYRNEAFGVALPRPFPDWVFSPGRSRETITVLFHPRDASLRDQLWGALVLTAFGGPVPLGQVADQRVATTWQPELGRTFEVLTRDTLAVAGLPALHIVMSGAVNHLALDVEEYFIARGNDLIILQLRYPRGLPRDSISAGYQRAFDGLIIRPPPGPAPLATGGPVVRSSAAAVPSPSEDASRQDSIANRRLAGSPWRPRAFDTVVRFDSAGARADVTVRLEVVNGDVQPRGALTVAVRHPFVLDGARTATGQALDLTPGSSFATVRLPAAVAPQASGVVVVSYHLSAPFPASEETALGPAGARCLADWLPHVTAWEDTLGFRVEGTRPRYTLRFDVPETFTAIAAGRLAASFSSQGRRRVTWVADAEPSPQPFFVIGRLRRAAETTGPGLTVRVWAGAGDSARSATRPAQLAEVVRSAWGFFSSRFGPVPVEEVDVVLADGVPSRSAGGAVFVDPAASDDEVREAVARAWWGSTVRFSGPGARWLSEALPAWSAILFTAASEGDSTRQRLVREAERGGRPSAAIESARRATGDALFRSALREFYLDHRRIPATSADLLVLLGPAGAATLGPHLQGR